MYPPSLFSTLELTSQSLHTPKDHKFVVVLAVPPSQHAHFQLLYFSSIISFSRSLPEECMNSLAVPPIPCKFFFLFSIARQKKGTPLLELRRAIFVVVAVVACCYMQLFALFIFWKVVLCTLTSITRVCAVLSCWTQPVSVHSQPGKLIELFLEELKMNVGTYLPLIAIGSISIEL